MDIFPRIDLSVVLSGANRSGIEGAREQFSAPKLRTLQIGLYLIWGGVVGLLAKELRGRNGAGWDAQG